MLQAYCMFCHCGRVLAGSGLGLTESQLYQEPLSVYREGEIALTSRTSEAACTTLKAEFGIAWSE